MMNPIVRTVMNLMTRHGGDAILSVETGESAYDPATSTMVVAEETYHVRVLQFDYLPKLSGMMTDPNSLIRAGDKQIFIKPGDFPAPEVKKSSITIGDTKYALVAIKTLDPSGTSVVLYEAFGRA